MIEKLSYGTQQQGLSTDIKPCANVPTGSSYEELDTSKEWKFSESNINPKTNNGWWEKKVAGQYIKPDLTDIVKELDEMGVAPKVTQMKALLVKLVDRLNE